MSFFFFTELLWLNVMNLLHVNMKGSVLFKVKLGEIYIFFKFPEGSCCTV